MVKAPQERIKKMNAKAFIQKCFDEAKTDIVCLEGECYDCAQDVSLEIEMDVTGKFEVQGGAFYSSGEGQYLKCNACYKKEPQLFLKCDKECEVYSRVVGYLRPVKQWNLGKKEEFKERRVFKME